MRSRLLSQADSIIPRRSDNPARARAGGFDFRRQYITEQKCVRFSDVRCRRREKQSTRGKYPKFQIFKFGREERSTHDLRRSRLVDTATRSEKEKCAGEMNIDPSRRLDCSGQSRAGDARQTNGQEIRFEESFRRFIHGLADEGIRPFVHDVFYRVIKPKERYTIFGLSL